MIDSYAKGENWSIYHLFIGCDTSVEALSIAKERIRDSEQ